MGKFSLRDFVVSTIRRMVSGGEAIYTVMRYAAGWYEKEVLLDEDMLEITALIDARESAEQAPAMPVIEGQEEIGEELPPAESSPEV